MLEDQALRQCFGIAIVGFVIYYVFWQLTVGARRRAMIKDKGCLPVKKYSTKDPLFGLDNFRELLQHIKRRTMLESQLLRFKEMNARTITFPSLGKTVIITMEPENLKTIQALDFKKWSLSRQRKRSFRPFLGHGIFTTDGAEWQHSREMLRPNFHRSQVGDLNTFESHVQHLVAMIPRDGSLVDLQDLFFRLTIGSHASKNLPCTNC